MDRLLIDDFRVHRHLLLGHTRVFNTVDRRLHTGASAEKRTPSERRPSSDPASTATTSP